MIKLEHHGEEFFTLAFTTGFFAAEVYGVHGWEMSTERSHVFKLVSRSLSRS